MAGNNSGSHYKKDNSANSNAKQNRRRTNKDYQDSYNYNTNPKRNSAGQIDRFEDISSYSSPRKRTSTGGTNKSRKPKKRRTGRTILAVILVLILSVAVLMVYMLSGLTRVSIDESNLGIMSTATHDSRVKNIALFGVDSRETDSNEGRSDSIIVLTVDNVHNKIKMTSILRDSEVYIEGHGNEKITHAYIYGGYELAVKTINSNFNLDITDFATVNFSQMASIVDAFGGIDIEMSETDITQTNENLYSLMYEEIHDNLEQTISESDIIQDTSAGVHHLNGNQAVAYARDRSQGDGTRAAHQQNVLSALAASAKKMNILQYAKLVRTIAPLTTTSIGASDVVGIAPILVKGFEIETLTIPGQTENATGAKNSNGLWVWQYDLDAASRHINSFIYEENSSYYYDYN